MRSRLNDLRWRVMLAATLLGATLSVLFAGATVYITEDYESLLVAEILGSEAQDYSLRLAAHPGAALPRSHRLSGYLRRADGSGEVPPELLALGPGLHEEEAGMTPDVTVGVFDVANGRLYFVMDLGDIELLEEHLGYFLAAIVLLGTIFAAWLGWYLAGLSLAPARRLAAAVDALPAIPQATSLAETSGGDELGRLASAIDRYQARLVDADAEERRFFADASHELRTPLAVVSGVVELILDDPGVRADQREWLERLERGAVELTTLVDVLLGVARGQSRIVERMAPGDLVADALASLDAARGCVLRLPQDPQLDWMVPRKEARLVLQHALGRLIGADRGGILAIGVSDAALTVTFVPRDASPWEPPSFAARGDGGTGSTLVDRLARSLGWQIAYAPAADGARAIRVSAR